MTKDWVLEVTSEDGILELIYYLPGLHKNKEDGLSFLITEKDLTLDILQEFIYDCRQLEIDEEAKNN